MKLLLGNKSKTTTESSQADKDMQYFTLSEIAQHDSATDLWMIIHGKVYDITDFIDSHPGGAEVLFECAGLDATEAFDEVGHSQYSIDMLAPLFKGLLKKDKLDDYDTVQETSPVVEVTENTLDKNKTKKKKVENVSIGESNWKQRNKKKKKLKDNEVFWLLTLLAIFAGFSYIYLENRKWNEFS